MLWGASGGGYSCSRIFPPSCCHTLKLGAVLVKEMAALFEARGKVVPWRAAAACHRSAGARPLYAVHKALCFYGPSGPGCGLVGHWRWGSAARIIRHKACERCSLQEEAVLLWGTGGGGVLPEWSITKLGEGCRLHEEAALLWGARGGGVPEGRACSSTALLAPARLSAGDSWSSGSTQLLCGVGGTLHRRGGELYILPCPMIIGMSFVVLAQSTGVPRDATHSQPLSYTRHYACKLNPEHTPSTGTQSVEQRPNWG